MKTVLPHTDHRVFFFDNLRYFVVLLVIGFHSMAGYTYLSDWWTVNDENFKLFDSIVLILDLFMMPALFFIAGYFALYSHQGKTTWQFIKKKMSHLGIPWLIGVIFINPIQMYIWKISQGNFDVDFWHCFLFRMESALSFQIALVTLSETFNQFSHFHFWFISLLFYFFVIFAFAKRVKDALFKKTTPAVAVSVHPSGFSILGVTFCAALLVFVSNMIIYGFFPAVAVPNTWLVLGNVLQVQLSRIGLHGVCFCLGIYACHKKWFARANSSGYLSLWIVLSAFLCFSLHELTFSLFNETSLIKQIIYIFLHPLCVFSIILTSVLVGVNYWDNASKTNRILAQNSYNMYLIHIGFVYLFQLVLLKLTVVPIYMKAVVVFILSAGISFLISHFAIKKSTPLSMVGIGIILMLMLIIL